MIKSRMVRVIDHCDLEEEVNKRFGCEIDNIPDLLFYECYNDYEMYYYKKSELKILPGDSSEEKEKIKLRNYVSKYLQETFPDEEYVLIDTSW